MMSTALAHLLVSSLPFPTRFVVLPSSSCLLGMIYFLFFVKCAISTPYSGTISPSSTVLPSLFLSLILRSKTEGLPSGVSW